MPYVWSVVRAHAPAGWKYASTRVHLKAGRKQPAVPVSGQLGRPAQRKGSCHHCRYHEIAELLCGVPGLDPNVADGNGWSALHHAAEIASVACVEVLVRVPGIDKGLRDGQGRTAWDLARATSLGRREEGRAMLSLLDPAS